MRSLPAGQWMGGNSGPARKTLNFVLAAFTHKHSILIGCLLLDSIIREVYDGVKQYICCRGSQLA